MLSDTLEHPGKNLAVDFERQAAASATKPRMIWHALALREAQELT